MANDPTGVTLSCNAQVLAASLRVQYTVENKSELDVYVLDTLPASDPRTNKPLARFGPIYLAWTGDSTAHLLQGIPPLPGHESVAVRVIPLGTKLPKGEQLERTLELPLPLVEQSPYYGPVDPQECAKAPTERGTDLKSVLQCAETTVSRLKFTLQYLPSSAEEFEAAAAPHGPNLYWVHSQDVAADAKKLEQQIALPDVPLLKRPDEFTRI